MRASYSTDRTRAGDGDLSLGPQYNPGTIRGVVVCHAHTHRVATFVSPLNSRPEAWKFINEIARFYPTVVADQGGDNWGNDAGIAGVDGCVNFLSSASNPNPAASGKVLLVGVSMGFQVACAWARTHLSQVAAIAGILPSTSVADLYANDAATKTVVDTAFGSAAAWTAAAPTRDPVQFASSLNVPIKLFYSSGDQAATPARVLSFANAAPNAEAVVIGNITHDTEAAYPLAFQAGLLDFLAEHA